MSLMNTGEIDSKNNESFINIIKRFWGFDNPSFEFIKERLTTDQFDPEYSKLLTDSKDQRVRWEIDFLEPSLMKYYSEHDSAYMMFKRKFNAVINELYHEERVMIDYAAFMNNKITYNKNETKLKKVFESFYLKHPMCFRADASIRNGIEIKKEDISNYIVKSFEQIGTTKKPLKKLQLVLSLNMCDWLLASTGGEISSCLNLEGGNRFWSGLPFLAGDPNRALLYITDGSKKEYEGIKVDDAITRTWVILTKDNKKSLIRWFMSEIVKEDAINAISKTNDFQMGMKTSGKNEITPLYLESGLITTIYMDVGCWEPNKDNTKFVHTLSFKGCYQLFSEDLKPVKDINFSRPHGGGTSWQLSFFKENGVAIDDLVPVTRCRSCGSKKMHSGHSKTLCASCFNNEYFICDVCGDPHEIKKEHYEGLIIKNEKKQKGKICSSCKETCKVCSCCGLPIANNSSIRKTLEGEYLCSLCLKDKNNNYKSCHVCDKLSKHKIITFYDQKEKTFKNYCKEHLPEEKEDPGNYDFTDCVFTRKPFKNEECPSCHSRLPKEAFIGKYCVSCAMSDKDTELMEL